MTVVNAVVGEESTGTAIEIQSTRMALSVSVTEDDILDLQLGQQATVAISATGGTATGTVTGIDPVAASSGTSSGTSSVVSYTVVVTLDEAPGTSASTGAAGTGTDTGAGGTGAAIAAATSPDPAAATVAASPLPGMSAEITIVIASAENVTAVPAIALSGTSGSYTVRVLGSDGSVESRAVEVGLIADDYAQITGGIAAGEAVVTGSSADRTSTTTTTTSSGRDGFGPNAGGLSGAGGFPQPPAGAFPVGN